jgi:PQQ-like domain
VTRGRAVATFKRRAIGVAAATALLAASCTGSSDPAPTPSSPARPKVVQRLRIGPARFSLPTPVSRETATVSNGSVYLAGGLLGNQSSANGVFRLDPTTGAIHPAGTLPHPVHDAAAAVLSGRLLVFGGGASAVEDVVQSVDLHSGSSAIIGHLPTPLADLQAVSDGHTVYLVGGYDGNTPQASVWATTNGRSFRKVATLPAGVRYPAVTMLGGRIVVAGGETGSGAVDGIWMVDPATGKVSQAGRLPAPTTQGAAFVLRSRLFVAGGIGSNGRPSARVWSVDPVRRKVAPAGRLPGALADTAVATMGDTSLLLGGWDGTTLDRVSAARLVTVTVKPRTPPTTPSAAPSASSADANARPFAGLMIIADRGNNRLLVMNAQKQIVWRYPSRKLPNPPSRFYFPDDAFWVHRGHAILINEEENNVVAEIAYPSGRWLWSYGHAGVPGHSPGYLHQPDDIYPYPPAGAVVADALNCRLLFFGPSGGASRQLGRTGDCTPNMPSSVGYPNGDTPLPDGDLLMSELMGGTVSRIGPTGAVRWTLHVAGVPVPSDPQRVERGTFLVVDYQTPGRVVEFTKTGHVVWSYGPPSGSGMLQHPSLGAPLPNGLVAVCDDYGHRVVLIDPKTDRIVWQYGQRNRPGRRPGLLSYPDGLDLLLPGGVTPLHVDFANPNPVPGRP